MIQALTRKPNFLSPELAEQVASLYESASDWKSDDQRAVYGKTHQSFNGPRLPADGTSYRTSFDRSLSLESSAPVLAAVALTGGTAHRCYRMRAGQGFRIHTDDYFRGRYAHVLYLNRSWCWDWGGLLHVLDAEGTEGEVVYPAFNLLATTDYFAQRVPHFVSPVAEWAGQPRYVLAIFAGA
jgi:Rps23 Pro-64 3,4-dihydroxylase Tpa1-like proline 4-hydroxylase